MVLKKDFKMNIENSIIPMTDFSLAGQVCAQPIIPLFPKEITQEIFNFFAIEDLSDFRKLHCVCKQWTVSLKPFKSKKVIDSTVWKSAFGNFKTEILPPSKMLIPQYNNLCAMPCPFNPTELFIDTHLIAYIGKEIKVMAIPKDFVTFPISIKTINKIFSSSIMAYNVEPTNELITQPIKEAKWIALYKKPLYIFRKEGIDIPASNADHIRINTAIKKDYRKPTLLELGILSLINHNSQKQPTWLCESNMHRTLSGDKFKDHFDKKDQLLVESSGPKTSSQTRIMDNYASGYRETHTFGLLACKDLNLS